MNFTHINNIIWDWNGTLLNDVDMCIKCMNQLLEPRNLPKLTIERYREVFTFPVKDYYKEIGIDFNKDPFDVIGHQFMNLYFNYLGNCQLHKNVNDILGLFNEMGKKQFVLSAMEQNSLEKSIQDFGIHPLFEAVFGIDNHLAAGKIERAYQMVKQYNINLKESILIGDTIHDIEVANELQIKGVLIANGHQSTNRLNRLGAKVYNNIEQLLLDVR